jgi:hypothetical protein
MFNCIKNILMIKVHLSIGYDNRFRRPYSIGLQYIQPIIPITWPAIYLA